MVEQNQEDNNLNSSAGILDAVIESEQAHELADFNPDRIVAELLNKLRDREKNILSMRYGLTENQQHTLESIGKKLGLTRERVRQIEKDSVRFLEKEEIAGPLNKSLDVVKKTISDHGGIFAQHALIDHLLIADKSERHTNALSFLLELSEHFYRLEASDEYQLAWHIKEFDISKLDRFHQEVKVILEKNGSPVDLNTLKDNFKTTPTYQEHQNYYSDRVIENFLHVTKHVRANPFGEYGLHHWRVIQPKDVGDKAYLVLKHNKEPLHYTKITELINQHKFDERIAYKETVHNELIMDSRFVLVGRGIYALAEWGYKKGLVSDVIREILLAAAEPVERNKIVEQVLKHRMVRRNTILVGLANKKFFRKVGKSKYELVV